MFDRIRPLISVLCLAVLCVALFACDEDSTKPGDDSFSLQVQVREPDGTPVEGLDVVVWNFSPSLMQYLQDSPKYKRAATRIPLQLSRRSVCSLHVYDLEDRLVKAVVDGDTLEAGVYQFVYGFDVEFNGGVEVQRYEAVFRDVETMEERYRESKLMTIVHLDTDQLVLGTTDSDGRLTIEDRTMIPGLFDTGPLPAVDENGELMGTFTLGTAVKIRVLDGLGSWVDVDQEVRDGLNSVAFTWDPAPKQPVLLGPVSTSPTSFAPAPLPEPIDRLGQNFPNPFN